MQVLLPDFTDRRCLELDLCGFMIPQDLKGIKPPKALKKALKAEVHVGGQTVYIGIVLPFPSSKQLHIHLKIARPELFGDETPQTNSSADEIFALLDPFDGKRLDVKIGGLFSVHQNQLTPFIRSMLTESQAGGVQVRMVAGTLEVTGGPIHQITWKLKKSGQAHVTVEASTRLTLTSNYLIEALDYIEIAYNAFTDQEQRDE